MVKQFLLFTAIFISYALQAQVATLYAGLSGVVGKKGDVDVEILTQIIADKQQELKKEFARRTLLNNINSGSYAFYNFADNTFDILFNSTNKTAASRKLIEASANLALAYGFTEFYLQASRKLLRNTELAKVFALADTTTMISAVEQKKWELYLSILQNNVVGYYQKPVQPNISLSQINTLLSQAKTISDTNAMTSIISTINNDSLYFKMLIEEPALLESIYDQYNRIAPGFNINTYLLDNLKPAVVIDNKKEQENSYALNFIFIDMVYDVLIKSEQISSLGFFVNETTLNIPLYQKQNKYLNYINSHPNTPFTLALINLRSRIENEINLLFRTYTLLNDIAQKELSISEMEKLYKPFNSTKSFINACEHLLKLQDTIAAFNPRLTANYNVDTLANQADDLFKKLKTFLIKAKALENDSINDQYDLFNSNDLLFVVRHAYPTLTKLSLIVNTDKQLFTSLDTVYRYILYKHINYVHKQTKTFNPALLYQKVNAFTDFVDLLTRLNDLDKASSYESILKIIQNAGALYATQTNIKTFNTLVNNIEKYTLIDYKENRIYVDVESIILAIYNRFANKDNSRFDFYFSIGLNQSFSIEPNFKYVASDTLQNFGYVAEKIGFKYKLVNIKKMRQYDLGEKAPRLFGGYKTVNKVQSKTPIVSDVHVIVFGSGLLYNIVNTKTSDQFKSYLLGTGVGLSFFNGLDLHVTLNYPLTSNVTFHDIFSTSNSYQMFAFSLDIKIGEYLAAVAQKASVNKNK